MKTPLTARRGVTLTDTLIAIAAVGVLVSILAPSLAHVKDSTRLAMCADNMRRLMEGVQAYGGDHAGKAPVRGYFSYTIAEQHREAYQSGGSTKVLINLGMLHSKYNGGQSDRLYCPATYQTYRDASGGWKSAFNPSTAFTFGSYNYAVPFMSGSITSPDLVGPDPYPPAKWDSRFITWINNTWQPQNPGKTFKMPDSPVLATDGFLGGVALQHGPRINTMYMDGHVRSHDIGGTAFSNFDGFGVWYKLSLKQ